MDEKELLEIIQKAAAEKGTGLNLSYKALKVLPHEITQLTNLTYLYLAANQLTTLLPEIAQLTHLTELNLSDNELTTLPPEVSRLINLKRLSLTRNKLLSLPPQIAELKNLKELALGGNSFSSPLSSITHLINLEKLWLWGLTKIQCPHEIKNLTKLVYLDISHNELVTLPPEITELSNLTYLNLSENQLTNLPQEITQLSHLTNLNLSKNLWTSLPMEVTKLISLATLSLSGNQLTTLPPEIAQLTNLTFLYLSSNELTMLPPEITQLTHLTSLSLSRNQLTTLPPEITQLTHLTSLSLSRNQLTTLPPEIAQLTNLTELYLGGNQLAMLPLEITQLTQLIQLDLSGNQLTTLPPEIAQLTQLIELNLSGNQLTTLPPEITQLTVRHLDISNNPFSALPPEIVEQGQSAILAYLKELLDGHEQQWVSKLMLVGEGGVGKTCLLRVLRGESCTDSSTTRGIEIRSLELAHPSQSDVMMNLNAWDFGGQEIYHATHQFFLTNRSLFLLVWNARHGYEQGKLYYWLDAIQARAPESPILVIATWIDERDADLPTDDLRRKYPQIVGFHQVSNTTGQGITELREAIAQVATTRLPLMGEKWPSTWLAAANAIRARDEKHILPDELWTLMAEHDVSKASARVLARWLHELGDILFFRDDMELNDLVILKPQWVTQYIGKVLESEDVIGRSGIFTHEHMQMLWSDLEPSMRQHFLRLMEKFDLSYRTLEDREVSLVVERLPLDPPEYQSLWNKNVADSSQHEISMKFKLNALLPGLPTWFIARSHRFSTHTHWRMGAVFAYELEEQKHLALVQALPHDRYIQLTVRGPSPHNFFALLKDGLEVTLRRYPGLKIERTVPCLGHNDQPCDYEFNYENLEKAIEREKPVESMQCQQAFEQVPVTQLLFGLHWRTQDNVVAKIEELNSKLDKMEKDHTIRHDELVTLLQREFTKNFRREQSQIESYCPNIFVLRPYASGAWKRVLIGEKLEMHLYCQAPGCWHPTDESGRYVFDYPPKWLRATGRYIQNMVTLLKYVSPLVGPWIGLSAADYAKTIAEHIKLMEELVKIMPDVIDTSETTEMKLADRLESAPEVTPESYVEGAELRAVRQLLEKLDEHQTWGGLQRVLTPEDHYLWLCEHHAQEYRR